MLIKSLSARVISTTSLLVIFSLSLLTYAGLSYFEQEFRRIISTQQSTMVSELAKEIDDKIELAARVIGRAAETTPFTTFEHQAAAAAELDREEELQEVFPAGLFFLNPQGQFLAGRPSPDFLKRKFQAQPLFFRHHKVVGDVYISEVFSLNSLPEPLLLFSAPVHDLQGRVTGYIAGGINLLHKDFLGRLPQMTLGQKGYLYLYDDTRRLLIHPDPERIMKQDVPLGANKLFDAALKGFEGTGYTVNSRGLKALASFYQVRNADWILAANYPLEEAYAPIRQGRGFFWGALVLAGAVSLLVVWPLARQLTAPLENLTRQIREIGQGEMGSPPLPLPKIRELRDLAEAFNRLQADLQQKKIRISEQQNFSESLVSSSALPCFVIDAQHQVLLWNRACEELTGVKAAEIIGTRNHGIAFYKTDRPCLADLIIDRDESPYHHYPAWQESKMVENGLQAEGWLPNLNGKKRYLFANAAPIFNRESQLVAVIENIEDLTEARLSHEETAEAFSVLQATFEATADGLVVEDTEGKVLRYNRRALQMWRLEGEEQLIRNKKQLACRVLAQVCDPRSYQERLRQIQENSGGESFDTLEFKDGRVFERYSRPQILNGTVVGRVWSFHDISQRRELENRLQQVQKMEAVGQLAGGVAHDFNNLLTVINGYSALLAESANLDEKEHKIAELVLQAGEKAADLTGQLLAFGRRQLLKPQVLDLNALIRRNEKILRHLLREDMEISLSLASDLGMIKVDPTQLEQILINLVVNARDAMVSGGRLSITTSDVFLDDDFVRRHPGSIGGQYALLKICDQGCGMSVALQERIFEPFFTTKEKGRGTGLGLATVYGIVKQSRGYLRLESEVGKGSCFYVYLPLTEEDLLPADGQEIERVRGSEKVLVVEDEHSVLDLVVTALTDAGFQVTGVTGGSQALEAFNLESGHFDLLLTDMVMPEMNGQQLAFLLGSKNPQMKVLYMSGYGEQHFEEFDQNTRLLVKPFTPDALLSSVREALGSTTRTSGGEGSG